MAGNRKRASPHDKLIPTLPVDDQEAPLSSIEQASQDDDDEEDEILNEEDGVVNARVNTEVDLEDEDVTDDDDDDFEDEEEDEDR
jgi:hypothetical protein